MAAPLARDVFHKAQVFRNLISKDILQLPRRYIAGTTLHHSCIGSILMNQDKSSGTGSRCLDPVSQPFLGSKITFPMCPVPSRSYGRKVRPKPQKITHFQYSGDLRTLPELDNSAVLYDYVGLEDQLEGDDVLKKLASLEFASGKDYAHHRKELIRDRIVELFGPDSELEQEIALKTLRIRQMIPYCIQYKKDKYNKILLLKTIFRRRRLLHRLRELDYQRFEWLLKELKIRYVIPRDREEFKGWKHNLRVTTQDQALTNKRQKLEALKAKFEEEKKAFYEHKAKVLAEIEKDLEKLGLGRDFLDELQEVKKEERGSTAVDPNVQRNQTEQKHPA